MSRKVSAEEVLEYIASAQEELAAMAGACGADFVQYFMRMAAMEAREILAKKRPISMVITPWMVYQMEYFKALESVRVSGDLDLQHNPARAI